jgi:formyltetrahydrofolate synthetase
MFNSVRRLFTDNKKHRSDTPAELELIREQALIAGADAAVVSSHWAEGGAGARELAEALVAACEGESKFKFLYDLNLPIEEKISIISKEIYGADGIELSDLAKQQIETYTRQGYGGLPSSYCLPASACVVVSGLTKSNSLHGENTIFVLS